MNKPATKEPSMDEILSSIRQIIADDDAAAAPRRPAPAAVTTAPPPLRAAAPAPASVPRMPEPLALTPAQMLRSGTEPQREPEPSAPASVLSFSDADFEAAELDAVSETPAPLVDPEDVAFESDELEPSVPVFAPTAPVFVPPPEAVAPPPVPMAPPPVPRVTQRPAPSVAQAAPMPDPTLSSDMAERLLAPAANAAVKHTFAKLNGISMQGAGMTLDDLMRDMLRPMLKEWLDENLPSLVERMVEKEIARISRGGE